MHRALLRVENSRVDKGTGWRRPDDVFKDGSGVEWAIFFLDDQEIAIGEGRKLNIQTMKREPEVACPTKNDWRSFEWVAPIEKASVSSGFARPSCFKSAGKGVHGSVLARFDLNEGHLFVAQLATRNSNGSEVIKWRFMEYAGPNHEHEQALADVVTLAHKFPKDRVSLTAQALRGGNDYEPIGLLADDRGIVCAFVLNQPQKMIKAVRKTGNAGRSATEYLHFDKYYLFSYKSGRGPNRIPFMGDKCEVPGYMPDPTCVPREGMRVLESPFCPPSRFEAFSG